MSRRIWVSMDCKPARISSISFVSLTAGRGGGGAAFLAPFLDGRRSLAERSSFEERTTPALSLFLVFRLETFLAAEFSLIFSFPDAFRAVSALGFFEAFFEMPWSRLSLSFFFLCLDMGRNPLQKAEKSNHAAGQRQVTIGKIIAF